MEETDFGIPQDSRLTCDSYKESALIVESYFSQKLKRAYWSLVEFQLVVIRH
jgi:hypothetical protein